ncbi:MAG: ABC transporter permease [Acidimicrobiales bacterium]
MTATQLVGDDTADTPTDTAPGDAIPAPDGSTPARDTRPSGTVKRRRLGWPARIAGGVCASFLLAALLAPLIAPYEPLADDRSNRLQPFFSGGHLLGTDGQGRDVLSRVIWGARPSILTGLIPVFVAGLIGTLLGLVAGLGSHRVNTIIMRTLDVFYAFPAVLLAIAIAAALGSGTSNAIIALSVILVPPIARLAESEVARIRSAAFMEAARVSGAGWWSIALRHVLPNAAPAIVVYCTALVGLSIVYAAGLGFLGLGVAPPTAEWGLMVNELRQFTFSAPGISLVPAVVILIASVAFNVFGDGLRDLLDVKGDGR